MECSVKFVETTTKQIGTTFKGTRYFRIKLDDLGKFFNIFCASEEACNSFRLVGGDVEVMVGPSFRQEK